MRSDYIYNEKIYLVAIFLTNFSYHKTYLTSKNVTQQTICRSWTIVLPSYLSIWMDHADRYLRAKKDRPRLDESIVSSGWRFRIDGERGVVVKWYPSRPVTAGRMLITRLINAVARVGETTDRMDRRHAPSSFFSLFLVSPFPNAFVNTFSSGDRSRPHYIIPYFPHAFLHRFLFLHLPRQSRFAKYPTLLARGKAFFSNRESQKRSFYIFTFENFREMLDTR